MQKRCIYLERTTLWVSIFLSANKSHSKYLISNCINLHFHIISSENFSSYEQPNYSTFSVCNRRLGWSCKMFMCIEFLFEWKRFKNSATVRSNWIQSSNWFKEMNRFYLSFIISKQGLSLAPKMRPVKSVRWTKLSGDFAWRKNGWLMNTIWSYIISECRKIDGNYFCVRLLESVRWTLYTCVLFRFGR